MTAKTIESWLSEDPVSGVSRYHSCINAGMDRLSIDTIGSTNPDHPAAVTFSTGAACIALDAGVARALGHQLILAASHFQAQAIGSES